MKRLGYLLFVYTLILMSCKSNSEKQKRTEQIKNLNDTLGEVTFMTLDPGHFHAALVQKSMYDIVDNNIYVYAPVGNDILDHLKRIEGYNTRAENPTQWIEKVYIGDDYLQKMLSEKPGNVMVVSGTNNR